MPRQGNESDILSQSSADDFDYSHMSTEERSLFTKVMFRWFSKAANDQLALLVDGWTTWRRIDKYLKSKQQKSLYEKRCQEAAQVLRTTNPDDRSPETLNVLYNWGRLAPVFESITEVNIRTLFKKTVVRDLQQGEPLFYQGDSPDAFWIVLSGSLSLFVLKNKDEERQVQRKYRAKDLQALCLTQELLNGALGKEVSSVASGNGIGELSLLGLGSKERACSAVAAEPTCMVMLETGEYNRFLRKGHLARMNLKSKVDFLLSVHIFSHWRREDVNRLVYGLKDVEYTRGTKLLESGQSISTLTIITEGNVELNHPVGNIHVALLGERDIVGVEALYKQISLRRAADVACISSRFNIIATTTVKGYSIDVEEMAKFCTGGHGQRTHKVLGMTMKLQEQQRRSHYKRARKWQKLKATEKMVKERQKSGLLYRLEEEKRRVDEEGEQAQQPVENRISFGSVDSSLESLGFKLDDMTFSAVDDNEIESPIEAVKTPTRPPSLPVIGVGGKQFPFNEPVVSASVSWASDLRRTKEVSSPEDSDGGTIRTNVQFMRIRDRSLPTLTIDRKGKPFIKEIPLPMENSCGGLAATSGWEAKTFRKVKAAEPPGLLEARLMKASVLLNELKKTAKTKRQKVEMYKRPNFGN